MRDHHGDCANENKLIHALGIGGGATGNYTCPLGWHWKLNSLQPRLEPPRLVLGKRRNSDHKFAGVWPQRHIIGVMATTIATKLIGLSALGCCNVLRCDGQLGST